MISVYWLPRSVGGKTSCESDCSDAATLSYQLQITGSSAPEHEPTWKCEMSTQEMLIIGMKCSEKSINLKS